MQTFPERRFDVTNWIEAWLGLPCCLITRKSLELQSEEVVLRTQNCCCNVTQRRPYAQLTLLEELTMFWGICAGINSDLAPMNDKGEGGIVPGCGCSQELVHEIVRELNLRKDGRGKVAQMRQQRFMLEKLSKLAVQVPLLLTHFGVAYPPDEATVRRIFGARAPPMRPLAEVGCMERMPEFQPSAYDVTCCLQSICCTSRHLELAQDEAVLTTKQTITGTVVTSRVPYANIESVNPKNICGCLAFLEAGELTRPPGQVEGQPLQPGFGCDAGLVERIRADLQARVDVRGNTGQIKQLEKMMVKFGDFAAELPLVLDKVGADASYPPSQQTMNAVYGAQGPEISPPSEMPHEMPSQNFPTRTFNVRNEFQNLGGLIGTCGIAGCLKHEMVLEPEQVVTTFQTNCGTSIDRKPYAQLRAVDEEIFCCCCHMVNLLSPGWFGDSEKLNEIAGELQARKVGRGNIAQLRNQENTMVKALESDIRMDILLKKKDISYPPSQQTLQAIYGENPPHLPPVSSERGQALHLSASEQMERRVFDITNIFEKICCCLQTTSLELNDEEAIFRKSSCCLKAVRREPYAQLGSVEPARAFFGLWVNVQTDQNFVCPGCGCDHRLTEEISAELQNRKVKRGNIAQIRQQENLLMEIIKLGVKVDTFFHGANVPYPPSQETMRSTFGPGVPLPGQAPTVAGPSVQVTVPVGVRAGDSLEVSGPTGRFMVTVPQGLSEGHTFQAQIPSPATAPNDSDMIPFMTAS